ncbi:uncharacterized protein LOC104456016 [Eucalyptus grandis]|uniref:uncharacterized protein LOC104456016 n=1 Tax=Eucalyptus grandis TaxID=71139 RepID=UPI00192EC797|nr:uncharacterized protein LOC104456016 [Eucalyptus grandis]
MQPIDDKEETVVIRAVSHDEEGKKKVEKTEVNTHNVDTLRYIEKKLMDKGVIRMERHPVDGIGIGRPPPKSGHGGKYTWEGPDSMVEAELEPVPPAIDERDPNYVDEEAEGRILRGEVSDVAAYVAGDVEVPKAEEVGVARIDVDPKLQVNLQ